MSVFEVTVLVGTILYLLYKYGTEFYDHWDKKGVRYLKPSFPFIGNSKDLLLKKVSAAENLINVYNEFEGERFGGIFMFRRPILLLRDPEVIKNVLVKDFEHFFNRALLINPDADPLFGKNLSVLQDEQWKEMRAALTPMFTSAKMKNMLTLINVIGRQMTDFLDELIQEQMQAQHPEKSLVTFEFKDFFRRFTIDVIATCAFGVEIDSLKDRENQFYKMGVNVVNLKGIVFLKYILCFMFPSLVKALKMKVFGEEERNFYTTLVQKTIQIRKEKNITRPDLIQLFIQLKDENSTTAPDGKKRLEFTDDEITAQAVVFFLAGFETVATSLSFTAYELAVNPDFQELLQEEIDRVVTEEGGITYEGVMHKMKYLDMVINESLRKWPPTILTNRRVSRRYVIPKSRSNGEVVLEKGEDIWIPIIASHWNPRFFPQPHSFDPQRFHQDNRHNILPFSFFPFGNGPRGCIGNRFGLMELKTCMVHLLRKYDLKVVPRTQIPLKLSRTNQSLTAEGGFWLGLKPRGSK